MVVVAVAIAVVMNQKGMGDMFFQLTLSGIALGFLSLLIGLVEGLLLARLFRGQWLRAVVFMTLANYIPMFAGIAADLLKADWLSSYPMSLREPLYQAPGLLIGCVVASYLLTTLAQWPIFVQAISPREGVRKELGKTALLAFLIVQMTSFGGVACFLVSSAGDAVANISLLTRVKADRALSFAKESKATVYFISLDDRNVYRIGANGTGLRKVADHVVKGEDMGLVIVPGKGSAGYDLRARDPQNGGPGKLVVKGVSMRARPRRSPDDDEYDAPVDLRARGSQDWSTCVMDGTSLNAYDQRTRVRLLLSLWMPLFRWHISDLTLLPGDLALYETGRQIVLVDLNARKIGLLARGRCPVAVLDEPAR